ncbi:sec-independent protein translocase protein TatC [Naumannella cuiyingiana]|uniref:Sec-independent protein translocase protein TatC n=1 Tax=Naumannella cuiyingiana TaxID=1347891 RepID=A0A7Z0DBU7_9ACTN|nr:twin-arginine translocase subunit TatC [Naumannella cuiyingiana]NYI72435.1 sec-independent protein translocase protein TatC [Naumannella cuiyingiana]
MTATEATGKRRRLSLSWLKPPPVPPDGNMTLFEHLRELRYRVVVAVIIVVLGAAVSAVFYQQLLGLLLLPYQRATAALAISHPGLATSVVTSGASAPLLLAMKVSALSGLVLTSPLWLYQVWAFIVPGLLAKEKRWAILFLALATPLFLGGILLGYFIMPFAIAVMLGFTPEGQGITNLLNIEEFLSFMMRTMLVFGFAFLVPLVLVMLNILGVVTGAQLGKARNYIIFGSFVAAALITPGDPISMIALGIPLSILFVAAEVFARLRDRGRRRRGELVVADS